MQRSTSNNINKRLANLLRWLEREKPEVVCLQELKTEQHGFPASALRSAGYEAVWVGERSWNSVAILAREQMPILTRSELPVTRHARYLEAAVRGVLIVCIYLPNGNPQPGPKFAYKLAWFERLILHANDLVTAGVPIAMAGDYNVLPTPQEIYPAGSLDKKDTVTVKSISAAKS